MPSIHIGTRLERPPGPKYLQTLHFAEMSLPPPLPRPATLARWRSNLPEGFAMALVAPRPTYVSRQGPLRFDADLEAAVDWLAAAGQALAVMALVLETGAELTTGQRDRDRLAAYVEHLRQRHDGTIVWAPTGLWEPDEAAAMALRLGLTYAFDPLEGPPPAGPLAYAHLRAVGGRQRLTEGMLEDALTQLGQAEASDAYLALDSSRSFREATMALQLLE
jgi:hypothetical protein